MRWWLRQPFQRKAQVIVLSLGGALMICAGVLVWPPIGGGLINAVLWFAGGIFLGEGLVRYPVIVLRDREANCEKQAEMIRSAQRQIFLTSRQLSLGIYVAWRGGEIMQLLEEKIRAGLDVQIICSESIYPDSRAMVHRWLQRPNFHLWQYTGDPAPHCLYVDGRELRIETPHPPRATSRENIYFRKPTASAATFLTQFDRYRSRSVLLKAA